MALNEGRLTWRHDSILSFLYTEIKSAVPEEVEMYSDLKGHMINNSVIPQNILVTSGLCSKPDLILISRKTMKIALCELMSPVERNLEKVYVYKLDKYWKLKEKDWKVQLMPLEVSSRGHILKHTQKHISATLKDLNIRIKHQSHLFRNLSKISLLCTFSIFHPYQTKEWVNPPHPVQLRL